MIIAPYRSPEKHSETAFKNPARHAATPRSRSRRAANGAGLSARLTDCRAPPAREPHQAISFSLPFRADRAAWDHPTGRGFPRSRPQEADVRIVTERTGLHIPPPNRCATPRSSYSPASRQEKRRPAVGDRSRLNPRRSPHAVFPGAPSPLTPVRVPVPCCPAPISRREPERLEIGAIIGTGLRSHAGSGRSCAGKGRLAAPRRPASRKSHRSVPSWQRRPLLQTPTGGRRPQRSPQTRSASPPGKSKARHSLESLTRCIRRSTLQS